MWGAAAEERIHERKRLLIAKDRERPMDEVDVQPLERNGDPPDEGRIEHPYELRQVPSSACGSHTRKTGGPPVDIRIAEALPTSLFPERTNSLK